MALHIMQNPVRLAVIALLAIGLAACSGTSESGREGGGEGGSEHRQGGEGREGGGGEGSGEHGAGGEGGEGAETGGDGEESGRRYGLTDTFDMTRNGARLVLRYDAASQTFRGTVTNTTNATLRQVRVEVHAIGAQELGPTKPTDLAPGQTILVSLDAAGQTFTQWSPHPEVGVPSSPVDPTGTSTFTPSLGGWAVVGGVDLGIEHKGHGLSAQHAWQGGAWTSSLSPPGPQHQPTGNATWNGKWVGYHASDPGIASGNANVTVTLGSGAPTEADLSLQGVPTLGTLRWNDMPVSGGRFMGSTTANSNNYDAVGQFGGAHQAGVVGHATGPDFRSVFYGNKN